MLKTCGAVHAAGILTLANLMKPKYLSFSHVLLHVFFWGTPSLFFVLRAEAPCSQVVECAKGQVQINPNVNMVYRRFANVNVKDAEKGCHELFQKFGYAVPIKASYVFLGETRRLSKFPMIKLSQWAQWLLDTGRIWRQFCGCATYETMKLVLREFWVRFEKLYPQHDIFQAGFGWERLSITIPYFSHQDEGRGYKHQAFWVLSCHGSIGRGTHEYLRREKDKVDIQDMEMGCNFIGNTWATQFLICTMLKSITSENPNAIDKVMEIFSQDAYQLTCNGLISNDQSKRVYMIHLSSKGDLPALAKVGGLVRTFSHVPRAGSSRTAANGICHFCLAGQEADSTGRLSIPYEEFTIRPKWFDTVDEVLPWQNLPTIMENAFLDRDRKAQFLATDMWHNVHLGVGKHWVANGFVCMIERMDFWDADLVSVDSRFEFLTELFKKYCKDEHISPHMEEISRASMAFNSSKSVPVGQWSKGAVTTHMMKFLGFLCDHYVVNKTDDAVMLAIVFRFVQDIFLFICDLELGGDILHCSFFLQPFLPHP